MSETTPTPFPEPFHCGDCTGKTKDVDGRDRGFLCPVCRAELITPYRNCDIAGHCTACTKTFNVDECPHVDDDEEDSDAPDNS
jgi:hypothetical protein